MRFDGVNGIGNIKGFSQLNEVQKQEVNQFMNSIYDSCDVDGNKKLENNAQAQGGGVVNEAKNFITQVENFIKGLFGNADSSIGTMEDVQAATNTPSAPNNSYNFDNDGNVISDVKMNEDGSKTITAGNETLQVEKDGNSFSVRDENGVTVAIVKNPDGGFTFVDEKGEEHKFDKDMNPM